MSKGIAVQLEFKNEEECMKPMDDSFESCDVSTQTNLTLFADSGIQTDLSTSVDMESPGPEKTPSTQAFLNQHQENLIRFRTKVDRMMNIVSKRPKLSDISNITGRQGGHSRKESVDSGHEAVPELPVEGSSLGGESIRGQN